MSNFKFKHLFFDLDRTLWDYETNCREVLDDIFDLYLNSTENLTRESFREAFHVENKNLWHAFTQNQINKNYLRKNRFIQTLRQLSLENPSLAEQIEDHYITQTPFKTKLLPGAKELVENLSREYTLHIITNGFEDVQNHKLKNIGLDKYFTTVITSDLAQARKPQPEIFHFALAHAGALPHESVIIGDDPHVDIKGAINVGIASIMYNSTHIPHDLTDHPEVNELSEVKDLLKELEKKRKNLITAE